MNDEKTIDEYRSILDLVDRISLRIFNTILPGSSDLRRYTLAILYAPVILATYVLISFQVGEGNLIEDNLFTAFVAIFAITFLLIAENVIGNNIRDTMKFVMSTFDYDERSLKEKYLSKIFSKWRIVIGTITGFVAGILGLLFILNFPLAGHNSPIIKYSALIVLFLLAFIFGEAGSGAIFSLITEYRLMGELSERMQIMNNRHHEGLKKVASWGLQISLLLSIIASAFFISLFTNPYLDNINIVFPFGIGLLNNQDVLLIIYGVLIFVLILVLVLFITPIYAISTNISEKKAIELETLSKNYNRIHNQVLTDLHSGSTVGELEKEMNLVNTLDLMERKVKKVSTIPYDIRSVRRIIEAILIPIITILGRNIDIFELLGLN